MVVAVVLLLLVGMGVAGYIGWGLGTRQERGRLARYEEVSALPQPGRRGGMKMRTVRLTK